MSIHDTAIIDDSSRIASTATIGPYCVIGPGVVIGEDTVLMDHVSIQCNTSIGDRNSIYPGAVIGVDPQDRKFEGEATRCEIGNDNMIREHVTIHRGTDNGGGLTVVGSRNLLMVGCHVAHDCILGDEVVLANQVMLGGHVIVEDGVSIGGGAGVHHFATIGTCAFVGGLARIARDVPPYMIVEGHPAEVRAINTVALVRRGFEEHHIDAVKEAFRRLFRNNGSSSEHIPNLRKEYSSIPAVLSLCDALEASAEGTHGRALEANRRDNKWAKVKG